jgi:hypothetical protein
VFALANPWTSSVQTRGWEETSRSAGIGLLAGCGVVKHGPIAAHSFGRRRTRMQSHHDDRRWRRAVGTASRTPTKTVRCGRAFRTPGIRRSGRQADPAPLR